MSQYYQQNEKKISSNLDDYVLQEKIGSGSFGKVYKVKNKITKDIYAAKISIELIDETTSELFLNISREINIIAKLNHPSVLKFILFSPINFKKKLKPVIITEYASNGSLSDLIEHDKTYPNNIILNDTRKLIIIYGIASAMSYLHSHNIIHRDLKPGNILLDNFLFPKIADFGLSKSNQPNEGSMIIKTAAGNVKGTPIYMAPEIWLKNEYSPSSDVYAFAIILFEIITNEKPFQNDDFFNLMNIIRKEQRPKFNAPIEQVYKSLIEQCWSQKPEDRPTFDQILTEIKTNPKFITEKVNEEDFLNYIKYIDEYKITFNSNNVVFHLSSILNYNQEKNKEIEINDESIQKINELISSEIHLPYKYFIRLNKENQKLVVKAESGDLEKQFIVGRNLIEGRQNFPFDTKVGMDFLRTSRKNGSRKSLLYYIKMIIKGNIIPKNHEKAKKLIELHLSDDKATYLFLLGKLYKKAKEYEEAKKYFKESFLLTNGDSLYEYAEILRKGYSKAEKGEDFFKYYKKSIEAGNLKSMFKYGVYLISLPDKEKQEEGNELIKNAVSKKCIKAMHYIGTKLENEIKNSKNDDKEKEIEMINYFKQSSYEGYAKSMNEYGQNLFKFFKKSKKGEDFSECLHYLKISSDKGFIDSMFVLGKYYADGDDHIKINPIEGERYVRISAKMGYVDAIGYYGTMLTDGIGVNVDINRAIKYYKTAIAKGSSLAMNDYAYLLNIGRGVKKNCKKAIKYYKMAIDKGNVDAMNNYAYMLNFGEGVKVDLQGAIKYFKMAIDKGDEVAMLNYGEMLKNGEGCEVNYQEAIKYFKMAIDKGDPTAMNNYGNMFELGQGVDINYQEAIKYYKMSIDKGDPAAMCNYAKLLRDGVGVKKDLNEAIKYFKMSIDGGFENAMYHYANMLMDGLGVEVDIKKAIKYYKMAIDNDHAPSMNAYAEMLWKGDKIEANKKEAIKYFKMAIDNNDTDAMLNYGKILCEGNESEINIKKGIKYITKASDKKDEIAQSYLGLLYLKGDIVRFNKTKGIKLYENSAKNGNVKSQINLGYIYHKGYKGIFEKDNVKSIEYYSMAAAKENKTAQFNLGAMYLKGDDDIPINKFKAALYFQSAAEQNDPDAQLNLGVLFAKGEGVPSSDYTKALDLFKKSSKQNNSKAQYNIGVIYSNGKGVEKNMKKAIKYYQKAADQKNSEALFKLGNIYLIGKNEIEINKEMAASYFEKGLDINPSNKQILMTLASMYKNGDGVEKNEQIAQKFYERASLINQLDSNLNDNQEEEFLIEYEKDLNEDEIELINLKEGELTDIVENEEENESEDDSSIKEEEDEYEEEEEEEETYSSEIDYDKIYLDDEECSSKEEDKLSNNKDESCTNEAENKSEDDSSIKEEEDEEEEEKEETYSSEIDYDKIYLNDEECSSKEEDKLSNNKDESCTNEAENKSEDDEKEYTDEEEEEEEYANEEDDDDECINECEEKCTANEAEECGYENEKCFINDKERSIDYKSSIIKASTSNQLDQLYKFLSAKIQCMHNKYTNPHNDISSTLDYIHSNFTMIRIDKRISLITEANDSLRKIENKVNAFINAKNKKNKTSSYFPPLKHKNNIEKTVTKEIKNDDELSNQTSKKIIVHKITQNHTSNLSSNNNLKEPFKDQNENHSPRGELSCSPTIKSDYK